MANPLPLALIGKQSPLGVSAENLVPPFPAYRTGAWAFECLPSFLPPGRPTRHPTLTLLLQQTNGTFGTARKKATVIPNRLGAPWALTPGCRQLRPVDGIVTQLRPPAVPNVPAQPLSNLPSEFPFRSLKQ